MCLFLANLAWTMIYDTIHVHQSLQYDVEAGAKAVPIKFRNSTKLVTSLLAVFQVSLLLGVGMVLGFSPVYFLVACDEAAV